MRRGQDDRAVRQFFAQLGPAGLAEADGQLLLRQENTRRAHRQRQAGDRLIGRSGGSGSCIVVRSRLHDQHGALIALQLHAEHTTGRPGLQGKALLDQIRTEIFTVCTDDQVALPGLHIPPAALGAEDVPRAEPCLRIARHAHAVFEHGRV